MRLPYASWKRTLRKLGLCVRNKTGAAACHRSTRHTHMEVLERREMLTETQSAVELILDDTPFEDTWIGINSMPFNEPGYLSSSAYPTMSASAGSGSGYALSQIQAWESQVGSSLDPNSGAPRIENLELVEDTGISATDHSTSNPAVQGLVTGESVGALMIEVDYNADSISDASVQTDENGSFTFTPPNPPQGAVVVGARIVNSSDPWSRLSFVYSFEPDGSAAANLAAVLLQRQSESQQLIESLGPNLGDADETYLAAADSAEEQFAQVLEDTEWAAMSAKMAAQSAYDLAVSSANNEYANASMQASMQLSNDLAAYAGDTTTYGMAGYGPFVWPDAPSLAGGPARPQPGPEGPPGVDAPTYAGSTFDPNTDASYASRVNAANQDFSSQTAAHLQAYNQRVDAANAAYDSQVAGYADAQTTALNNAQIAYEAMLNGSNPYDLDAAWEAYHDAIEQADDAYDASIAAANANYSTKTNQAWQDYAAAVQSADTARSNAQAAAQQAYNDYIDANMPEDPTPEQSSAVYEAAGEILRDANADADHNHTVAVANAQHALNTEMNEASREQRVAVAQAELTRSNARSAAERDTRRIETLHAWFDADREAAARRVYEEAVARARQDYTKSVSDALRQKIVEIADADRDRKIDDAQSGADRDRELADAWRDAFADWAAQQGTSWANFQADLADIEATRVETIAGAQLAFATAAANGEYNEKAGKAAAQNVFEKAVADATATKAIDQYDAKEDLEQGRKADYKGLDLARHDADKAHADKLALATFNHDKAVAEADEIWANANSAAERDYAVAVAAAQCNLTKELISQAQYDQAVEDAADAKIAALAGPQTTHESAKKSAGETRDKARQDAHKELHDDIVLAEQAAQNSAQGRAGQRDIRLAQIQGAFDIAIADARRIENNSSIAAEQSQIDLVAPARLTFETTSATANKTAAIDSVEAEAAFRIGEATGYANVVAVWAAAENTPWADYRAALAWAEVDRVTTTANADVAFVIQVSVAYADTVVAVVGAETTFALETTAAEVAAVGNVGNLEVSVVTVVANANVARAQQVSNSVTTFDQTVTDANKVLSDHYAAENKTRNKSRHEADWDYWFRLAVATWEFNHFLLSATDYAAEVADITHDHRVNVALAEETFANNMAAHRQAWTSTIGDAKVQLTQDIGAAFVGAVSAINNGAAPLQSQILDAGKSLLDLFAAKKETMDKGRASAAANFVKAEATEVRIRNTAYASAEATHEIDVTEALGVYELAIATDYAAEVLAWATVTDTHHAWFLADVAAAEAAWTEDHVPARNTYVSATVGGNLELVRQVELLREGRTHQQQTAQITAAHALAGSSRQTAQEMTGVSKAYQSGLLEKGRARATGVAGATATYNNTLATATRQFEIDVAAIMVAYVDVMAAARRQLHVAGYTEEAWETYNDTLEAEKRNRDAQIGDKNIVRVDAIGDAAVTWKEDVGTEDVNFTKGTADLAYTFFESLRPVMVQNATRVKTANDTLTQALTQADVAYATNLTGKIVTWDTTVGPVLQTYVDAVGDADVTLAGDVAAAEAAYHIEVADDAYQFLLAEATAQCTVAAYFQADWALGHLNWMIDFADDYVQFKTQTADALATEESEKTAADIEYTTDVINAGVTFLTTVAPLSKTMKDAIGAASSAYLKAGIVAQEDYQVAMADAKRAEVGLSAPGTRQYNIDMAQAEADYEVALAELWKATNGPNPPNNWGELYAAAAKDKRDAEADALLARTTAHADGTLAYQNGRATAHSTFAIADATAGQTLRDAKALAIKTLAIPEANAVSTWIKARGRAGDERLVSYVGATGEASVSIAQAEADMLVARTAAEAAAIAPLATQYDIPWVRYLAARSAAEASWMATFAPIFVAYTEGLAAADNAYVDTYGDEFVVLVDAAADALAAYNGTLAGVEYGSATKLAEADFTYLTTIAPAQAARDQASGQANRDYTVAVAQAQRDLTVNEDPEAHSEAMEDAAGDLAEANETATETYESTWIGAVIDRSTKLAASRRDSIIDTSAAEKTYTITLADAIRDFKRDVAEAEFTWVETTATLDADYLIDLTSTYATAMATFAAADGSPWSAYDAAIAAAAAEQTEDTATATKDQRIADANAERTRKITQAEAERQEAVDQATALHSINVIAAHAQYVLHVAQATLYAMLGVALDSPPALTQPELVTDTFVVVSDIAADDPPTWYASIDSVRNTGPGGDGFYDHLIATMYPEFLTINDTYSNWSWGWAPLNRLLGEGVFRPILGDEWLISASDGQLVGLTLAIAAPAGIIIYFGAVLVPGTMIVGGLFGFTYAFGDQALETYWYHNQLSMDWTSIAFSAAVGAILAPLTRIPGLTGLGFRLTFMAGFAYLAGTRAYEEWQKEQYVGAFYHGAWALYAAYDAVKTARNVYRTAYNWSASAGSCFVAGTQVWIGGPAPALASNSSDVMPNAEEGGFSAVYFVSAAGVLLLGTAIQRRSKRRRGSTNQRDDVDSRHASYDAVFRERAWDEDLPLREYANSHPLVESSVTDKALISIADDLDQTHASKRAHHGIPILPVQRSVESDQPRTRQGIRRVPGATQRRRSRRGDGSKAQRILGQLSLAACLALACALAWAGLGGSITAPQRVATAAVSSHVANGPSGAAHRTKSIERIEIGERVLGLNPLRSTSERALAEPDWETWNKVTLEVDRGPCSELRATLLRPQEWLANAREGQIHLDMPEMGVQGMASIIQIEPCPPISPGDGSVVTGTFAHAASGPTVSLAVEGSTAPIQCTTNHAFWSEDRGDFVPAEELRPGEQVRVVGGLARILSNSPGPSGLPVYNIEVFGEHVYQVGPEGVLVHNSSEIFYRAMSFLEYNGLVNNGRLTLRSTEMFVTQSRPYAEHIMAQRPTDFELLVRFHVRAGTTETLRSVGQRNEAMAVIREGMGRLPLIESGNPDVVHIKGEFGAINYGLRANTLHIFNDAILSFEFVK